MVLLKCTRQGSAVVKVRHSSLLADLRPGMSLKIGKDRFVLERMSQDDNVLDWAYVVASGVRVDWCHCLWEASQLIPFNATANEMKAALDSISALGMVHVTKSTTEELRADGM